MNSFWNSPITLIRHILSITGFWPYLTTAQTIIRTIIMNISLLAIYPVQVHTAITMKYTMEGRCLSYIDNFIVTTFMCMMYYMTLYHKKLIFHCFNQIISDWQDVENTKEINILLEYASFCRKFILTLMITAIALITISFFTPTAPLLLDIFISLNETKPRTLPYPMDWLPQSEKYFVELLLLQYFFSIVITLGLIGGLSIYITCLQHICAMFRVIACLLDNILQEDKIELNVVDNNAVCAKIIRIIGFHDTTTNFMDTLNANLNISALMTTVFGISVGGLRVVKILTEIERNADIGAFIIPVIITVFLLIWAFILCYVGQHLLDVSSNIFHKVYETPWYLMSNQMQKLLYILMMRARKASYISIGKMFVTSHEFLSSIIQIVVSYSTILYAYQRRHISTINPYQTT